MRGIGTLVLWAVLSAATGFAYSAEKVKSGAHEVALDKLPNWVAPGTAWAATAPAAAQGAASYALVDIQTDWRHGAAHRFTRTVMRVTDNESLKLAGELSLVFNPAFEKLTLHEVTVHRGKTRLKRLQAKHVRVVQQESDLHTQRMLTGQANAIVVVPDIRVGDLVEYAYSVQGVNPVLGNKRWTAFPQSFGLYVETVRNRLLTDQSAPISWKAFEGGQLPIKTVQPGRDEYQWTATAVKPVQLQPTLPAWFNPYPRVHVSESETWGEVATWGRGLFAQGAAPASVATLATKLRSASATHEEAAARALQFVQEDIRYLGIEIGQSAYKPADPAEVLERRYGDCKDKVNLYLSLLRAMGIESWPALVAASSRQRLADFLPSAQMFDHVIAVVRIAEREYWVDPTETMQGESLASMRADDYGYALLLKPEAQALTAQPRDALPLNQISVVETLTVKDFKAPVLLKLEISAQGQEASELRRAEAGGQLQRYADVWTSAIRRVYPQASPDGGLTTTDDRKQDRFSLSQAYLLSDVFEYSDQQIFAHIHAPMITEHLQPAAPSHTAWPLSIGRVGQVRHEVRLELPEGLSNTHQPMQFSDADSHLAFSQQLRFTERGATVTSQVRVLNTSLPGNQINAHMERRKRWQQNVLIAVRIAPNSLDALTKGIDRKLEPHLIAYKKTGQDKALSLLRTKNFEAREDIVNYYLDHFQWSDKQKAELLSDRATYRTLAGKWAEALQDVNQALDLHPDLTQALLQKSRLLLYHGRFAEVFEPLERAEQLGADGSQIQMTRGVAHYYLNDFNEAAQAFKTAVSLREGAARLHPLIWLYMAVHRQGGDAKAAVAAAGHDALDEAWPEPGLKYLSHEIDASALAQLAQAGNAVTQLEQRCDMLFLMGQRALLEGDKTSARNHFEAARATEAKWFGQYAFLQIELGRL